MTREEIVAIAAEDAGVSKAKAAAVLSSVLESITDALSEGDKVTFVGFGTFSTSDRAARTGRNPQTGATIQIPATTVPKFKAGKKLKEAV
ncbi:MAG: DNA-binding protein HU [Candidatus Latescibacterota bacterium]|nr:HU family DNA-binding protein [Candidatus Latescibacterota bacterium]OPX25303.1 MAG: DNA-binding protein HU [Candidatus Latescibacteria bacterium 4484_107]RKY70582.1 MAG: DNA-binding protein HU [Candidatus Latescibacterota bacterium]